VPSSRQQQQPQVLVKLVLSLVTPVAVQVNVMQYLKQDLALALHSLLQLELEVHTLPPAPSILWLIS
jgi:hypothetical protein